MMRTAVPPTPRTWLVLILIVAAALSRLLPHPFNFSPIGAIALFGGAMFASRLQAVTLPLAALFLSDVLLEMISHNGFYRDMIFVYGSVVMVVMIGHLLRNQVKVSRIVTGSLAGSVLFFLVTNFGTFLMYDMYPHTFSGLMLAYDAGIPFFRGTVLGDLFYNCILFGSYFFARRSIPAFA